MNVLNYTPKSILNNSVIGKVQNFLDKSDLEITKILLDGTKDISKGLTIYHETKAAIEKMTIGNIIGMVEASKDPEVQLEIEKTIPVVKQTFNDLKLVLEDIDQLLGRLKIIAELPAVKTQVDKFMNSGESPELKAFLEKISPKEE